MKRIVAVNSNTYHGFSLEEAIAGIRAAGFHFIELTATQGWTEHVFRTMPFDRLVEIKDSLKQAGLAPFSMSGHTNLMDPERMGDFIANIHLAHFFGCDYIVSSVGEAHIQDRAVASLEDVVENIRQMLPVLEECGLTLVLENHGEHSTGQVIKSIVEQVGSPRVKVNYDTANVIFYAGIDPTVDLATCIDQVAHLHIKDKAGAQREWNFPALGQGTVNFPRILAMLDEAGNASPLSIEIEFTQAGPGGLDEVNRAVAESARYLQGLGVEI